MKSDQVQVLNYCTHAIEDLREVQANIRFQAPESARVIGRLVEMLQNSVKFILPNCCNLVDPDEIRQAHLDLNHLPYPCVAFEAPWEKDEESFVDRVGEFDQYRTTKRIALCWELRPEFEVLPQLNSVTLGKFPDGGVFVVPIYWVTRDQKWTLSFGGSFVPYENTLHYEEMENRLPASRIAHTAEIEAGLAKPTGKQFKAEPFLLLPEFFEHTVNSYGGNLDKAFAQIMLDTRDEVQMLIEACSVINCANVTAVDLDASAALNKKRREKGKEPFYSYKVLQLSDERRVSAKAGGHGGSHASPRMHLRRGHLRRLDSKAVWVRPTMVNAGSTSGAVAKDYAVQRTHS